MTFSTFPAPNVVSFKGGQVRVIVQSRSREGLAEEQPAAYKDVDVVVDVVHRAGLSLKVARLRPLGVIKG
jgi:tRNA-splicing ligase RtcB